MTDVSTRRSRSRPAGSLAAVACAITLGAGIAAAFQFLRLCSIFDPRAFTDTTALAGVVAAVYLLAACIAFGLLAVALSFLRR